jgi:hypothetical protein
MLVTIEIVDTSGTPLRGIRAQILHGYRGGVIKPKVEDDYVSAHFIEFPCRSVLAAHILIEGGRRFRIATSLKTILEPSETFRMSVFAAELVATI